MTPFNRTFHPDEANQAFTTGKLLETGRYEYRPDDHHGPTLYYAAAALQKLARHNTLQTLDGTLLRATPLLFACVALLFAFLGLRRLTRRSWTGFLFILLFASAPIFVFFATDFIQEMLLVCFTLMMGWAGIGYLTPGRKWKPGTWALMGGIAAGLAYATKETCVLSFAAAFGAWGATCLTSRQKTFAPSPSHVSQHIVLAILGFLLTAGLFYTSFGSDLSQLYNAFVAAPLSYLGRAVGSAASAGAADHVHPWWTYLAWLGARGFGYCELLLLLPLVPALALRSVRRDPALRFCAFYTFLITLIYSVIPYKTPWCALQIVTGLAASAALAVSGLWCHFPRRGARAGCLLLVGTILSAHTVGLTLFLRDPDAKDIPYNYASASPEVKALADCVAEACEEAAQNGRTPFIAVALPPEDTWPFPWYNRPHEEQTGYWTSFDDLRRLAQQGLKPTAVIVPMREGHLVQPLFPHLKRTKRFYMRAHVRVRVFY